MRILLAGKAIAFGVAMLGSSISIAADDMCLVESGSYTPLYKSADGQKLKLVDAFLLDRYAVTNAQFYRFTEDHQKWQKSHIKPIFSDLNYLQHLDAKTLPGIANQPVTNVSWFAARAYCKAQGKRLPMTDEWEYASYSDDPGFRQRILDWYAKPVSEALPEVTDTPVNKWGIQGMHGVVWELVDDFNTALVTGESRGDSQLEQSLFCGAGAAASSDPSDYAAFMRYALRSSYQAHYTMTSLGFRCASDNLQQSENDKPVGVSHNENS
jgi:formylglycine-generating enzyme required for sulfatase activity